MAGINDYSDTVAGNDGKGIFDEGQSPPTLNNGGRQVMADIKNLHTVLTAAGTDTYTATIPAASAPTAYVADLKVYVDFTNTNTGACTLNLNSLGAKSIKLRDGSNPIAGQVVGINQLIYDGTDFILQSPHESSPPRGYISGLTLARNGTDPARDIDIGIGQCADSGNTTEISPAAVTRQSDAAYATGNGGLSSSLTIAANTTYYIHAIIDSSGASDIAFDTSSTAANLVTDHSITKYRQIGQYQTDASSNIDNVYYTDSGEERQGRVKLESITASSDSQISFVGFSGFTNYEIVIENLAPATDNVSLISQVSADGGSTWKAGASDYVFALVGRNSAGVAKSNDSAAATGFILTDSTDGIGNAADEDLVANIIMFNPGATGTKTKFKWHLGYISAAPTVISLDGYGVYNAAETIDGIRFTLGSGNIATGTFTLYGIK